MLKAIKKTRIYEEVVNQVHDLIREGKLKAGDQLPSERELADTFKVSRASVREAIRALEAEGLIISRTGAGTFVAQLSMEPLVDTLAALLSKEKDALADIFEMRGVIEPEIASLAAERATENDIEGMKKILEEQRRQVQNGESGVQADTEFHFAISQATQNQALQRLVSAVMDILSRSREESLQTPGRNEASMVSHYKILEAIERHDRQAARRAMVEHIEQVEKNILPKKLAEVSLDEQSVS